MWGVIYTNKHELSELFWLNQEIAKQKERLRELEAKAQDCNAKLTGMPQGTNISSKTEQYGIEIAELKTLIEINIQKCWYKMREIERFINELPNARERLIMRLRYINHLTWDEIAEEVTYSRQQVINIHNKILKNANTKKDCTKFD